MNMDYGQTPYVADVGNIAGRNQNFRVAIWTGCNLQMTIMSIPVCGEIGTEIHPNTDQMLRIERGRGIVKMGSCECNLDFQRCVRCGDVIFVPAGTWHNVINTGGCPLKVSSVYAPPNHPFGTVDTTKEAAEMREEY